jgi:CheY-like chemotaxis protein
MAKIMIIDDDVDMVEMYQTVLKKKNHEIVAAYTAAEAREKLKNYRPDVVVLDVMMETEDAGFQLGRDIHKQLPTTVILFLSSIVRDIDERVGIPNTFEADTSWLKYVKFLNKPVKAETLIQEIKNATENN